MEIRTTETSSVLYSRPQDGSHAVHVLPLGYRLDRPDGSAVYQTKRQLLIAVTGHPKARNWTFDRYFRQGKWNTPQKAWSSFDLVDFFTEVESSPAISVSQSTAEHLAAEVAQGEDDLKLGIDLVNRADEVAKLLFAGFGSWIYSAGYDPEDVLQEVYKGLLIRNKGKCPWDVRKSSFGHYVYMVCNGVLSNWHRKVKRVREHETTGLLSFDEHGDLSRQDVGSSNIADDPQPTCFEMQQTTEDLLAFIPLGPDTYLARSILPYVRDGYTCTDIARVHGVKRTEVSRALETLRHYAGAWAREEGCRLRVFAL
jgi:hypothetical protein